MKARTRIVHVITSLRMGGAESLLVSLLERFPEHEFEHHVVYFYPGPFVQKLHKAGIATHYITGLFCLYDPLFFIRFFRCLAGLRPAIIHALLWSAMVISRVYAWCTSTPVITVYHNNCDQNGVFRTFVDRMTVNCSTRIVAVSDQVKQSLITSAAPRIPVQTIVNGVDKAVIMNRAESSRITRASLQFADSDYVVGSVGRFEPVKRYDVLLQAVALASVLQHNLRLVLVGSGSQEGYLRELAQDLGIAALVRFVVGQQAYGYYNLFDCFVQSSNKEGISLALLEALTLQVPVLVASEDGVHPVIKHGVTGLVWQAGNSVSCKKALQQIITHRLLADCLAGAAAAEVADLFSFDRMVNSYLGVMREVISER